MSLAKRLSPDEEDETSEASGTCFRIVKIIELCKAECNCF